MFGNKPAGRIIGNEIKDFRFIQKLFVLISKRRLVLFKVLLYPAVYSYS